ncbi:MAG: hypothetical protein JEZ11_03835 [Desulfobacterales bacterium]|nr:hypothetical protein [Desulfobacterales bacterium]
MNSYDQWKTASPDEDTSVDVAETLARFGRVGHGLCGKDADLDPGGQIKVVSACYFDAGETWRAEARLQVYANICSPEGEEEGEIAESIIMDENQYHGEWTGSDYWCFSMRSPLISSNDVHVVSVNFPIDLDNEPTPDAVAQLLSDAIWSDPEIKAFQASMADLSRAIDAIPENKMMTPIEETLFIWKEADKQLARRPGVSCHELKEIIINGNQDKLSLASYKNYCPLCEIYAPQCGHCPLYIASGETTGLYGCIPAYDATVNGDCKPLIAILSKLVIKFQEKQKANET